MSQPLLFSSVSYCHKPLPEKAFFPARLFHQELRKTISRGDPPKGRQSPDSFFERSETPAVVVRLRAIPTVKRRLTQRHHPFL